MKEGRRWQAQGFQELTASAPVALSCPHGVEKTASQEASGLEFGMLGKHPRGG